MYVLSAVRTATVLAAPSIPPVVPSWAQPIVNIAGWLIFGVGMCLVLAFFVGVGNLAWAHYRRQAGPSALGLGIVMLCGVLFGAGGAIMNGLF